MIKETVKDLSELSVEERYDVARQVLLNAPYTIDTPTFKAYTASIGAAANNVALCKQKIESISEVGCHSGKVDNLLQLTQTELRTRAASYEFISEAYAWGMANESIRADDVSNSVLNANLKTLADTAEKELGYAPSWYGEIVSCIESITGVDIRISQYN